AITVVTPGGGTSAQQTFTIITPTPTPTPVLPTPSLIAKKTSKKGKAKLFIHVTFSDGRSPEDVLSPFQKPRFKGIAVTVNAAGNVVVSAKKGKRTVTQILSV